ncbi:FAD/NAD(P)-binding protein [Weissella minor]|uniref:FAD/NAD(P)-binding protein n=1 Tax=Weissella minor TaxID=1620 RepID=UPI001BAEEFA1|nr:FAD/NAD(P)-binding protein [Weissella minor]MBS0948837.1 FAD/NAD(P)-binding protein [Weissella minor]
MNIVLIGAGPRNLVLAERLVAYANASQSDQTITLADPYPIGGAVWHADQNPEFIANTISQHLTLFSDDTVDKQLPATAGPNFYDWVHQDAADYLQTRAFKNKDAFLTEIATLDPNHFSSRALFGLYASYYFETIQNQTSAHTHLNFKQSMVTAVEPATNDTFKIIFADETTVIADAVAYAPGYTSAQLTDQEQAFKEAASKHLDWHYLQPMQPSEAPLKSIRRNENVLIRGLGLSFFDYISGLTIGRGGRYERRANDQLVYIASGDEPHIIAGSRTGTLPRSKAFNQKTSAESYDGLFFTTENIDAHAQNGKISYDNLYALFEKEMTYKYYFNLMSDTAVNWTFNRRDFLLALQTSEDLNATAIEFGIPEHLRIDWSTILNPLADAPSDYQEFIEDYLQADITDAKKGNDNAPLAGTFELLKDLRGKLRNYIDQDYLDVDEFEKFLKQFNPINRLLNIGPPILRTEQLEALMRAGIITIAAPQFKVEVTENGYKATDEQGNSWTSTQLVEARLPGITLQHTADPVLQSLSAAGLITDVQLTRSDGSTFEIDAVYNDRKTLQAIDTHGAHLDNLFIFGTPTEGWNWFTSFAPRPNVNDKNLRDAETIAHHIFNN